MKRGRKPDKAWEYVDWSLQDCDIADKIGYSQSAVASNRKRFKQPPHPRRYKHRYKPPTRYPWDTVDWSMQNTAIAKQLGCTHQMVTKARVRAGAPPSPKHGGRMAPFTSKYDWGSVDWSLQNVVIADLLGCFSSVVATRRQRGGHPDALLKRKKRQPPYSYDWDTVDWDHRDSDIAKKLGCTFRAVTQQRSGRGEAPSPFKGMKGHLKYD